MGKRKPYTQSRFIRDKKFLDNVVKSGIDPKLYDDSRNITEKKIKILRAYNYIALKGPKGWIPLEDCIDKERERIYKVFYDVYTRAQENVDKYRLEFGDSFVQERLF